MTITKEQALETISQDLHNNCQVGDDKHGETHLIVSSWEDLSQINDELNIKLAPLQWPTIRAHWQELHDAKVKEDKERNPKMHESKRGIHGRPFRHYALH